MTYKEGRLKELLSYMPSDTKEPDLTEFWEKQISISRTKPLDEKLIKYDYPCPYADVYEIEYAGIDDTVIHGWYIVPNFIKTEKMPCIIHYHGFTGNRGKPIEYLSWILMGYSVIATDCRAQSGYTGDAHTYKTGLIGNVCMQGILDKEDYYFKFLYMDALRAVDFAVLQEKVDPNKLILEGGSQGGALSLAVASLDDRPFAVLCDVPSNCEIHKRIENGFGSFSAVREYLKTYSDDIDQAFKTVSYFDIVNLADRIKCPVFASASLLDDTCPGQYFFAAYNRITSPKEINVYPFNRHEGGGIDHAEKKLKYISTLIHKQ